MKDHFVQIDVPIDRYNGLTVDLRKLPEEDLKQTEWCDEKFENNLVGNFKMILSSMKLNCYLRI